MGSEGSRSYGTGVDSGQRFVELMTTAPAQAPLDYLWALLSAAIEPDRQVGHLLTMLDQLAEVVRADGVEPSFDGVVSGLFGSGRLVGDVDSYHDVANSLLHSVIERGRGMPITLSIVAIEVGRRLGVPILGIGMPAHFVIRDAASERYADPFGSGVTYSKDGIVEQWQRRTHGDRLPASALVPNSTAQVMLRVLNNLSVSLTAPAGAADPRLFRLAAIRLRMPEFAAEQAQWRSALRHWN
jgi:regulator of sirC expression with transglutaminase-like and TPR domain